MRKYILKLNWPSINTHYYFFSTKKEVLKCLQDKKKLFPYAISGSMCGSEHFVIFKNSVAILDGFIGYKYLYIGVCENPEMEKINIDYV